MFSDRARPEAGLNALTLLRLKLERDGVRYIDLTCGNPTQADVPYARERILAAFQNEQLFRYEPDSLGPLSVRKVLTNWWSEQGLAVAAERILLTASTSEAYALLFKLLCDPGDEVLVPAPSYPLFEHLARFEGVAPVAYPLGFDGAWFLDVEAVRRKRSARTRAIVVVSPNNPTGHYLKRAELERLAELGLPLISDEVFASYAINRPNTAVSSALEGTQVLTFALSGLSKLAALPQMKLAWTSLSGPEADVAAALSRLELLADAYLSPSTPVLRALPELLASRDAAEHAIHARVRKNHTALQELTQHSAATVLPVEGGWYAVLRLPRILSEEAWALELLAEAHVWIQPGYFYDFVDEPYIVLSLLTPEAEFFAGASKLLQHVARRV